MSIQVGQKAPDFALKTNKMKDFKLSDLQGQKNAVLLFVKGSRSSGSPRVSTAMYSSPVMPSCSIDHSMFPVQFRHQRAFSHKEALL